MKTLHATKRSKADKAQNLRANGLVPAVVYGARVENTPISVSSIDFLKIFREAGESTTIILDMGDKKVDVLIHDVQVEPIRNTPIHIDFLAVDMNKKITVTVPLEFDEVAPAAKAGLGVLVKVLHEVEIEALPGDLPHAIHVSLEKLQTLEDQIHVKDLAIGKGVTILTDGEEVVALVSEQKEETEDGAPIDLSSIEVEKKGKKEEEGAE